MAYNFSINCVNCDRTVNSIEAMKCHSSNKHPNLIYSCEHCMNQFSHPASVLQHQISDCEVYKNQRRRKGKRVTIKIKKNKKFHM
ncbi:hypothetical protein Lal_00049962 [Lupinus albus]|nr:hypothetical protein Lal_00049962 [Lupinus albus]